jgi:hypothetical protein
MLKVIFLDNKTRYSVNMCLFIEEVTNMEHCKCNGRNDIMQKLGPLYFYLSQIMWPKCGA